MNAKTDYAKSDLRFLGAFLACLLAMAMAWTGFYLWCRVNYGLRYTSHRSVLLTVPPGAPAWVNTWAQKTVSLEELIRGEKLEFQFSMGDTF